MTALTKNADRFVETAIDDETVVMDMDSAEFFSLNSTAGAVWRAIDGARSRDEVVAAVAAEYAVSPADIGADVDELIEQLVASGFVRGG